MRPLLLLLFAAAACAPTPPASAPIPEETDDLVRARLGQSIVVGGPRVTPLAVLEDSRCPINARCVWAGRVRLRVRVDLGSGSRLLDLTQGQAAPVADGTLELVEVRPDKLGAIKPGDYRFGFRFMGGL